VANELSEIIKRTNKANPSPADKSALQQYIAENGGTEIARIGELSQYVKAGIITEVLKSASHITQVAIGEHLKAMATDLGYETASPLERLLIDNITLTWLRYHVIEWGYNQVQQESSARAERWDRRLSMAHRRYLRSIEALARVRRLLHKPSNNVAFNFLLKQQLGGG
jgi:hypothetical protein